MHKFTTIELYELLNERVACFIECAEIEVYGNHGRIEIESYSGFGNDVLNKHFPCMWFESFNKMETFILNNFEQLVTSVFFEYMHSSESVYDSIVSDFLERNEYMDFETMKNNVIYDLETDFFGTIDSLQDLTENDYYYLNYDCYESVSDNAILEAIDNNFNDDTIDKILSLNVLDDCYYNLFNHLKEIYK